MNDLSETRPFQESSPKDSDRDLQTKFAEEGYLCLKQAIDPALCRSLLDLMIFRMRGVLELSECSWSPTLVGEPFVETDKIWDLLYPQVQSLEAFHKFFHCHQMLTLMRRILGVDPFVYPMKMARIATPRMIGFETPPHQDVYSHHSDPTMAGIWVALHNVDETMGRLTILDRSHKRGVRKVLKSPGVGGVQCEIYDDEHIWHVSNLECGDVIVFSSHTVHKAEPNLSKNNVRVSVDTRFCEYGAPVFSTNLEPHHGWRIKLLDWQYIYRDWKEKSLKYYWHDYKNVF